MQIFDLGLQTIQKGLDRADRAGASLVRGVTPEAVVELKQAERQVEVGARLIGAGDRLAGTLLDVLA